jgi:tetratricopeptide (TPR) repeat protein
LIRLSRALVLVAGAYLALLVLAGCAPQSAALRQSFPYDLLPRVELDAVPHFATAERYLCGPETLAAVLRHAGNATATVESLTPQLYLPGRQGTLQIEMLAAARRNGASAFEIEPSMQGLLRELNGGTPVVVLLNLSLAVSPLWHYAVAVGYDADTQHIMLRSGPERRQIMPWSTFENVWGRSGFWGMAVLPAGKLPASASERQVTDALVAFERVAKPGEAVRAYEAALTRWPASLTLRVGLGNALYAANDKAAAVVAFRQAAEQHQSAAAWLNLAQTLADLKQWAGARDAAARAVQLGGQWSTKAQLLLQTLPSVP